MKITVNSTPKNRISINSQSRSTIRTVAIGTSGVAPPTSVNTLSDLIDVDATDADDGETLVYDEVSGKYIVKEIPIINGGTF